MRHLGSLVLSIILAPIIYALLMRGIYKSELGMLASVASGGGGWSTNLLVGIVLIIVGGALYAALLLPRFSPLGPAVAGLLLLSTGIWTMFDLRWVNDHRDLGLATLHMGEVAGMAAPAVALGIPLMMTIFSPRRWRRVAPVVQDTAPTAAPGYSSPPPPQSAGFPSSGQGYQPYPQLSAAPAYPTIPEYGNVDTTTTMPMSTPPASSSPQFGVSPSSAPPFGAPASPPPFGAPPPSSAPPGYPAFPPQSFPPQSAGYQPPGMPATYQPPDDGPETTRRL